MVCSYLDHAAVDGQGGAKHVDVGCGGGALPLGECAPCGWVGRGVVEGMRGGVAVHGAGSRKEDKIMIRNNKVDGNYSFCSIYLLSLLDN